ncbi:MAG: hypothetical protein EHM58_03455 [Ignavibacteriae bacterium]|nr:MAG: hypothetical protein EHM58_03455 [Ignavibacteriota bacterium]
MDTINQNRQVKVIQNLLRFTYGLVPVIAGLDKFTNLLVDWKIYLNPNLSGMLPMGPVVFMYIVGVIEIAAGILTLAKPRIGGYVVMAWLILIALNLISMGAYFDIAVRDLVMSIGAFSLAQLSALVDESKEPHYAKNLAHNV